MTSPHYPDTDEDKGTVSDRTSTTGTPGWVKMFAGVGLMVVLLVVVLQFVGSGSHGPGRHLPTEDASDHLAPAHVTEEGVQHP